jgi:hypothetical protein
VMSASTMGSPCGGNVIHGKRNSFDRRWSHDGDLHRCAPDVRSFAPLTADDSAL